MKEKIREYFSSHRGEIRESALKLLGNLVKAKTVNCGNARVKEHPYLDVCGDESKAVAVLENYFKKSKIKYSTHELIKGRGNIVATYGEGDRSLCIGCHLDVVPAGDPAAWSTDPFVMTEKDGKVYGRGTMDNKGQVVACVMAMEMLQKLGIRLNGKLILAGVSGEEFHEKDEPDPGFGFLSKEGYLKPTFAIVPDIGGHMRTIDVAEKGRTVIIVKSIGKQAHGARPELGINAVTKLAHFIVNADGIELKYKPHATLVKPSINLGIMKGGSMPNNVPNLAEATFDIRYLPGQTADGIIEELKKCAGGIEDGKFEFEIESDVPPHELDPNNILVKTIQSNAREILGFTPETIGQGGGTFAKGFNLAGIQAVGFGPGDDDVFHVANEYLEIDEMLQFVELIACITCDLLGSNG